jgi:hypothetical protein
MAKRALLNGTTRCIAVCGEDRDEKRQAKREEQKGREGEPRSPGPHRSSL